jgi:hypothetical protein
MHIYIIFAISILIVLLQFTAVCAHRICSRGGVSQSFTEKSRINDDRGHRTVFLLSRSTPMYDVQQNVYAYYGSEVAYNGNSYDVESYYAIVGASQPLVCQDISYGFPARFIDNHTEVGNLNGSLYVITDGYISQDSKANYAYMRGLFVIPLRIRFIGLITTLLAWIAFLFFTRAMYKSTVALLRRSKGRCMNCNYSLYSNQKICPECGTPVQKSVTSSNQASSLEAIR